VKTLIAQHPNEIAAIIIEPVAGNMGCILPQKGYLEGLRSLCDEHNMVWIFDEVMTGFRLAAGGAQQLYNIKADLVTYGKIIGGGLPVGAFGGRKEIMQHIAPLGSVYQAGTLSGNPIAMIAGYTLLKELKENPGIYAKLEQTTRHLSDGISAALSFKGIDHTVNQLGSMMSVHFGKHEVIDFETAKQCDIPLFNRFFHHLLQQGVYLPPSAYESWFISSSITDAEVEATIEAVKNFN
jgi:glutamate-1-semialdehyde 2,1-aminomutase